MEEVKLLGTWPSPYVLRAKVALALKGVKYESLEEVEVMAVKSELLLSSNPVYKKVPVLIHAGKPISESLIIVQYVDETWPGAASPIMPADPYDRAVARFWAFYMDDKLFPSLRKILIELTEEGKELAIQQVLEGMQLLEVAFEKCSKGKPFFGGENIGYLDIALGSCLGWFQLIQMQVNTKLLDEWKTPLLVEWAERFLSHPVVKELMPENDHMVEYVKKLDAFRRSSTAPASAK